MRNKLHFGKPLILLSVVLAAAGAAVAYLTYHTRVVNQILVGSNTITITEEFQPPQKQEVGDNCFKKKIQIQNTDQTDSFVRVFLNFSDSSIKDLARISPDGTSWYDASLYLSADCSHLPENWVYISEADDTLLGGYFYYTIPLKKKEMTVPLAERIMVTYTEAPQIHDFDILVTADSIQTYINEETEEGILIARDLSQEADGWKSAWTAYMERR